MADHTLVNLREVEDLAPKHGLGDGLESRFARTALGLRKSGLTLYKVAPGFRLPFGHTHGEQEEVYLVVSDSARMKIGDEIVDLREWDAVRVPPDVPRGFEGGSEGAELLAFGAPNTENKDAEMDPEFWPR